MNKKKIVILCVAIFLSIIISSIEYYHFEFPNYVEKIQKIQKTFGDKEITYIKNWEEKKLKISPLFLKKITEERELYKNLFCYQDLKHLELYNIEKDYEKEKWKEIELWNDNNYINSFSRQVKIINFLSNFTYNKKHCIKIFNNKIVSYNKDYYNIEEIKINRKITYKVTKYLKYSKWKYYYSDKEVKSTLLKNKIIKLYNNNFYFINYIIC